jgi:hypothetical protein
MKVFTTLLAVSLGLWICGAAAAQPQDLRNPDQVAPAAAPTQDLRNPDQVAPSRGHLQDLRNPDQVAPTRGHLPYVPAASDRAAAAPVPASDPTPASDGGLSTLLIVLICVGGAVALTGAGYATVRAAHNHGHAAA